MPRGHEEHLCEYQGFASPLRETSGANGADNAVLSALMDKHASRIASWPRGSCQLESLGTLTDQVRGPIHVGHRLSLALWLPLACNPCPSDNLAPLYLYAIASPNGFMS